MKPTPLQRLGGTGPRGKARTRHLTVPAEIAAQIPDGSTFLPELTDDGLLFRPVHVPKTDRGPGWLAGKEPHD